MTTPSQTKDLASRAHDLTREARDVRQPGPRGPSFERINPLSRHLRRHLGLMRLLVVGLLLWAGGTAVHAQSSWVQRYSGTTEWFTAVTYGGGQFVAVNNKGVISTSPDGIVWSLQDSGVTSGLNAVTYGDGLFMAVGDDSVVLTSSDGVVWTQMILGRQTIFHGVAYGDGTFVVAGSGPVLYNFSEGRWGGFFPSFPGFLSDVTFGDGKFVALSYYGAIISSPDGKSWSTPIFPTGEGTSGPNYKNVTYFNGSYILTSYSGAVLTSTDAENWVTRIPGDGNSLSSIAHDGHLAVIAGWTGTVLTSPNGADWTEVETGVDTRLGGSIAFGAGRFVVVGRDIFTSESDAMSGTTFEDWRQLVFTTEELDDPSISGPDADPNATGTSNFARYAFGLPHDSFGGGAGMFGTSIVEGADALPHSELTFQRPADRIGIVDYQVRFSADLVTWFDLVEPELIVTEVDGMQTIKIVDSEPVAAGRRFYVLQVSDL